MCIAIFKQDERDPVEKLFRQLDSMVGLHSVKEFFHSLHARTIVNKERMLLGVSKQNNSGNQQTLHMVFMGPPGTGKHQRIKKAHYFSGKTSVALLVAKLLHSMGLIKKGHMVNAKQNDLIAPYMGQTGTGYFVF